MGFLYESFQNKTNWVIWNFWSYETNPQNKSLENRPTKQIHNTNLLKKALQIKYAIQIFRVWIQESGFASPPAWICKDSFCAIVLRIHQDLWGFVGFVKTGHKTNPWFESLRIGLANPDSWICEVGFVNHKMKRIFLESGFVTTIQNKSTFLQISYTIPASLVILFLFEQSFAILFVILRLQLRVFIHLIMNHCVLSFNPYLE